MNTQKSDYSYSWWRPHLTIHIHDGDRTWLFIFMKEMNTSTAVFTFMNFYSNTRITLIWGDTSSRRHLARSATARDERSGTRVHQSISSPSSIEHISQCTWVLKRSSPPLTRWLRSRCLLWRRFTAALRCFQRYLHYLVLVPPTSFPNLLSNAAAIDSPDTKRPMHSFEEAHRVARTFRKEDRPLRVSHLTLTKLTTYLLR